MARCENVTVMYKEYLGNAPLGRTIPENRMKEVEKAMALIYLTQKNLNRPKSEDFGRLLFWFAFLLNRLLLWLRRCQYLARCILKTLPVFFWGILCQVQIRRVSRFIHSRCSPFW